MATNYEILLRVSKQIHKHEKAKKVLINVINRALLRSHQRWNENLSDDNAIPNLNALLIGKSGTGKTYLMETLARVMDFHLVVLDATDFAPTSADGKSKCDIEKKIFKSAETYFSQARQGKFVCAQEVIDQTVVFVDEIDKLGQECSGNGNWNAHTQATFLTTFENKTAGFRHLTWVFAGAFTKMHKDKKGTAKPIGFEKNHDHTHEEGDIERDIIAFGLIPELVGRIHHVVELDELTIEDFETILNEILIPKKVKQLSFTKVDFDVLQQLDVKAIAAKAHKSEMGVRAMMKAIDNFLIDIEFNDAPVMGKPADTSKLPNASLFQGEILK